MPRNKPLPFFGILILFVILIIVIAIKLGTRARGPEEVAIDLQSGIAYLQALEDADPGPVENKLKEQRQLEMKQQREERLNQLLTGEVSVWTMFEDYVLLGDSRAVGYEYYEFLDQDRVIAEGGATIRDLSNSIPDIKALNPSYIFLCYGLNDVSIGYWNTPEEYVTEFKSVLQDIHRELPNAKVFVSSILIARDPAFELSSAWYNIPEFSAAVGEMCDTMDHVYFVDNADISETYADLWDSDGIHLNKEFYPYWAANMIMEVYDSELEQSEDPAA